MQLHEIRKALHGEAYDFLRTNPHLGSRVMLLGLCRIEQGGDPLRRKF